MKGDGNKSCIYQEKNKYKTAIFAKVGSRSMLFLKKKEGNERKTKSKNKLTYKSKETPSLVCSRTHPDQKESTGWMRTYHAYVIRFV